MNQQTKCNQQNDSNNIEITDSLKFAFLGNLFSMVGEILATYAAKLAINETIKKQNFSQKINKQQKEQIILLQKQVQELQQQMENLK